MILDTSALAAIFFAEPEAVLYIQLIHDADRCRISAANFVELSIVIEGQIGLDAGRQCDTFLRRAGILVEPVTLEQAHLARQAFLDFGKRRHPAGLNFGDCFAYALAKATAEPLLFKGEDFKKTDIASVL
jgi:ribonuclease VapC